MNNVILHNFKLKQIDEITATDISRFIYNELIKAKSLDDFDSADTLLCEQLNEHQHGSRFLAYYKQHVRPLLKTQLNTGIRVGFASGANWTNNNAESKNKIIKLILGKYFKNLKTTFHMRSVRNPLGGLPSPQLFLNI